MVQYIKLEPEFMVDHEFIGQQKILAAITIFFVLKTPSSRNKCFFHAPTVESLILEGCFHIA